MSKTTKSERVLFPLSVVAFLVVAIPVTMSLSNSKSPVRVNSKAALSCNSNQCVWTNPSTGGQQCCGKYGDPMSCGTYECACLGKNCPTGGGTAQQCRIQGYKVVMPNNQRIEPAAGQTVMLNGKALTATNPAYIGVNRGTTNTVSVTAPVGYGVGYTLCVGSTGCHTVTPTKGNSVTFNCSGEYADLWWHYYPAPNCSNLTASRTTLGLGESTQLSANFTSVEGDLKGQIFYGTNTSNMTDISGLVPMTGTSGTISKTWTPSAAGVYNVCCRTWNDAVAECRPAAFVDGAPRVPCAGPNTCTTVTVAALPPPVTIVPSPTPTIVRPTPTTVPVPVTMNCVLKDVYSDNTSFTPVSRIPNVCVGVGTTVLYELTYANTGAAVATNVQLIDMLPKEMSFINSKPGSGCAVTDTLTDGSRVVTCNVGNVPAYTTQKAYFRAKTTALNTSIYNSFYVKYMNNGVLNTSATCKVCLSCRTSCSGIAPAGTSTCGN